MFLERMFPYLNFRDYSTNFPRKIKVGLFYTMSATEDESQMYSQSIQFNQAVFGFLLGSAETLLSLDTFHVKDYSKIVADVYDAQVDRKSKHQLEEFPKDLEKAFEMGARFIREAKG